jgi:nickel-type superoxide dismutase maturation protease
MTAEEGSRRTLFLFLGALGGVAAVNVAARRWLDLVEVEGTSMAPALVPGDRLLVESLSYRSRAPRVGDIVLAADPREPTRELVKRVATSGGSLELRGDAPDASTDSRTFGAVPATAIRWRAVFRYWPLSRAGRL